MNRVDDGHQPPPVVNELGRLRRHITPAAVELVKLREALAEKGFTPRSDVHPVATVAEHRATKEIICRSLRPTRSTRQRLSLPQGLAKTARDFKDSTQRKIESFIEQEKQIRRAQSRGMFI